MYSESLLGYLQDAASDADAAAMALKLAHMELCEDNPLAAVLMEPLLRDAAELTNRIARLYPLVEKDGD
jgi:hypothetical protein